MLAFPSATSSCVAPVAHKFVSPRPGLNLNSLTFLKSQPTLPVRDVTPWSHPLSGIFIVTSLNDTSAPHEHEHLRSCLHLTNPCAKQKVLSLTKPKGKICKMKSLSHYITNVVKLKTFHNLKCKTYSHEKFNTSKGVIRNKELTQDEIKTALEKQGSQTIKG